jgi:diguanylate cyclase (GGDEF)-like protein
VRVQTNADHKSVAGGEVRAGDDDGPPTDVMSREMRRAERCTSCGQPMGYWPSTKLTGLLDRWGRDDEALPALSRVRRQGRQAALLIVDLDHFKQVNDEFGHFAGDAVLQYSATVVRSVMRSNDILRRYGGHGGDEFLVLLPGVDVDNAVAVAECVREGIEDMKVCVSAGHSSTASLAGPRCMESKTAES